MDVKGGGVALTVAVQVHRGQGGRRLFHLQGFLGPASGTGTINDAENDGGARPVFAGHYKNDFGRLVATPLQPVLEMDASWPRRSGCVELGRNKRVGKGINTRQIGRQVGVEAVAGRKSSGRQIRDLCVFAVRPDHHFERQVDSG